MGRKAVAATVAMHALRGWFVPIPTDMDVSEVLREIPEMGGIELSETAKAIAEKAKAIEGSSITYIAVNVVDGDIMISMLVSTPDLPLTNEKNLFARNGYALAYVYNNNAPWCSEFGDIYIAKNASTNFRIRRIY